MRTAAQAGFFYLLGNCSRSFRRQWGLRPQTPSLQWARPTSAPPPLAAHRTSYGEKKAANAAFLANGGCAPKPPRCSGQSPLPLRRLWRRTVLRKAKKKRRMPLFYSLGFMVGKKITSRMEAAFVSSIIKRSMPMPMPPVGGIPYSTEVRKSSSVWFASSSPAARSSS